MLFYQRDCPDVGNFGERGGPPFTMEARETGSRSGMCLVCPFFFSSRRRHTRFKCDWSSDVCSSDLKRIRAGNDNTIVVIPGANALVSPADVTAPAFAKRDIAVSQFEIPLPVIGAFFHQARAAGATTILNPAPAIESKRELLDLVDILILNESELGFLAEIELHDTDDHAVFIEAARSLQTGKDKNHLRDIG